MSGICGWLGGSNVPGETEPLLLRLGQELTKYDGSDLSYQVSGSSGVAVSNLTNKSAHRDGSVLCAIEGSFHWKDDDFEKIPTENSSAAVLAGFRKLGPEFLKKLEGNFALAIIDEEADLLFIAADRIGVHTLYFEDTGNNFLFASNSELLRHHPNATRQLSLQAIYDYLYFHVVPAPDVIYENQSRLLPGHYLYKKGSKLEIQPYWSLQFEETLKGQTFSDLKAEFRVLLRRSIEQSITNRNVGAFLSGGTDSSTVSGLLTEITGQPAATYSIGFDEPGYDEMEYARLVAKHFGTKHHEYYVTAKDIVKSIPKIADAYGQPFGNSSAVPAYYCAKMAKEDGIELILAGDGGDELFAGNARYAKQQTFALYNMLPRWSRKNVLEPLFLNSQLSQQISQLRKLKSFIAQASIPMPARMQTYNLLERAGIDNVLTAKFLEHIDTSNPLRLFTEFYGSIKAESLLNKMLGLDIKFTLSDNDLQKVSMMCELAGIDVSYPLLSDDIAEFSAKLPSKIKLKGNKLRYFFKESLKDFLPDEVINKKKHGFGLPFGHWSITNKELSELVNDSLADLKKREIVRSEFIDELVTRLLPDYPHYYGEMVWIFVMLEQWMKCHIDSKKMLHFV
jgi:asparagine synthase (glutamine-hydrolysing)